jgi:ferredoxin-NADP reductase/ferredoxin
MQHLLEGGIPVWTKGLIEVKVADIVKETHDTYTYRFVGKDDRVMFSYQPGQFVTLILNIDGKEVRRSYSMSSTPSRPHCIELTIKRVPEGLVSNWLADNLKIGDAVKLRGPSGTFTCFEHPADKLLFIGAGSGITPLMSMSRWILDTVAEADVKFLVSARTPRDIIYRQELEFLSARHNAFKCLVTLTGGPSGLDCWVGMTGRLTAPMLEHFAPDVRQRFVFTCGPEAFMDKVEQCLRELDFDMNQFYRESFGIGRVAPGVEVPPRDAVSRSALDIPIPVAPPLEGGPPPAPLPPDEAAAVGTGLYEVFFAGSGKRVRTNGEADLLKLAEANGVGIEYQCRNGTCGRCRVLCASPENIEMPAKINLDDDERAEGYILACVARPKGNVRLEV